MVVRHCVAILNDNNCRNINSYLEQGMSALESFNLEAKNNGINPNKIIGYEIRTDKWNWLFCLLDIELKEVNNNDKIFHK